MLIFFVIIALLHVLLHQSEASKRDRGLEGEAIAEAKRKGLQHRLCIC
jgi:hypothetical protein